MASKTLKAEAHEARLQLEQANMRLTGIIAAHQLLHANAESDTPLAPGMLYSFLDILDEAIVEIRDGIEAASCLLLAVSSEEPPPWCDGGSE